MKKALLILPLLVLLQQHTVSAQQPDTAINKKLSVHFQSTLIPQYHFNFNSPYQGQNSLLPHEPVKASLTGTLFTAFVFAPHSYIVFNPEVAGGKGLSKTLGIAGFPNGEIYRVGNPAPKPYIARLYIEHRFPLAGPKEQIDDDVNQVAEFSSSNYISVLAGKFSLTDFFGNVEISHDPRTQFLNWSLMGHGAWDYPANTRGYTFGAVIQAIIKNWAFKYANTFVPVEANGMNLQWKPGKAMGMVWEIANNNVFKAGENQATSFHAGVFWNKADMGDYAQALNLPPGNIPDITQTRMEGRSKWGYYFAINQNGGFMHLYAKGSWNDGKNETWAFTEIDRSASSGFMLDGKLWKRKDDELGIACVANWLSDGHRAYLSKGGYGFLIGDGRLTYGSEQIVEVYYSLNLLHYLFISPDYQFIAHPGYNKDRGPVHVVSMRFHVAI
ncbi:MAG TPA: carbohydrate porin [Chitinophagaceae bacterium]|nr:carbohydrate porin [Chitinophagaceae bacterium]